MTTKLVSYLGTGAYGVCTYRKPQTDRVAQPSRYMACAAAELYDVDDVVVLMTDEAEIRHGPRLRSELKRLKLPAARAVRVSSGGDTDGLWQSFDLLKEELRYEVPGVEEPRALGADDVVVLDITHGFRSQPFFAAAVVSFVRAIDADGPKIKVVYGAWEARTGGPADWENAPFVPKPDEPTDACAPVWDLTPFVDVLDWTAALHLFLKTGRPSGLSGLSEHAPDLVSALTAFGEDLVTGRTGALLLGTRDTPSSSSRALRAVAAVCTQTDTPTLRPLMDVLGKVEAWLRPLRLDGDNLSGPEGQKALAGLARLYLDLERYFEVFGTVKEGLVSVVADPSAACPGSPVWDTKARQKASVRAKSPKDGGARNDLMHMGYRPAPKPPAEIKTWAERAVKSLEDASTEPKEYSCGRFINLSAGGSTDWLGAQREAAMSLGRCDAVVDLPIPAVDVDADVEALRALAASLANKVQKKCKGRSPKVALVEGDPSFCWVLIHELQGRGVDCVVPIYTAAGAFKRFRRYM